MKAKSCRGNHFQTSIIYINKNTDKPDVTINISYDMNRMWIFPMGKEHAVSHAYIFLCKDIIFKEREGAGGGGKESMAEYE